jgi:hypothetical protein
MCVGNTYGFVCENIFNLLVKRFIASANDISFSCRTFYISFLVASIHLRAELRVSVPLNGIFWRLNPTEELIFLGHITAFGVLGGPKAR